MKYLSIDVETTGLDIDNDQLIEIGMVVDDLSQPLETLPRFHCYIAREQYAGHPFALSMHAAILRRIANREPGFSYLSEEQAVTAIRDFLQSKFGADYRINVAGKNYGSFDSHFLSRLPRVRKEGGKLLIGPWTLAARTLDPGSFMWQPGDTELPNLKTCYQRAGISGEVAHTAIEDAMSVVKLVRWHHSRMNVAWLICRSEHPAEVFMGSYESALQRVAGYNPSFRWTIQELPVSR